MALLTARLIGWTVQPVVSESANHMVAIQRVQTRCRGEANDRLGIF